jgi:transcriptional regulator with XRE-family HTH domain
MNINGEKVKQLRLSKKLSKFKLALDCDISQSSVDKIENGSRSGLCVAYKIAKYFNITIEELI